ncbi:putative Down syndrome cell adhesion molecule-like protein 1 isoform X2 [Apostichopus japonicus]|uniref:Putative Down syndrome cell adhesion molecule-like protein 1 isoform X2 n=1 Tax=Stichopus japonicus TaxID=307972 RepID=A0A2G8L9E2_STIJA|nr:putative Down syndrome cell adhesion molecule-like protein 1 isoform X2 [Apostichopus japonicus]
MAIPSTSVFIFCVMLPFIVADIIFREEPRNSVVVQGQPISFHCVVEDNENRGRVIIQWLRNNAQLQLSSEPRLNLFPNGTLFITAAQGGDEGRYACQASVITFDGVVEQKTSVAAMLRFAFIKGVFYHPPNLTVTDQQSTPAYFQCISGDSLPVAVITWEKDGNILQDANQYSTMFGSSDSIKTSGTLQIDNVRTKDAGRYRCITMNPYLPGLSKTVIMHHSPFFVSYANRLENEFYLNGEDLSSSADGRIMVHPNGTLIYAFVVESDEGTFVCNGTNSLGFVVSDEVTLLTAYIEWTFLQEPDDVTVVEEEAATLICRPPNSKPAAVVTWYKDNSLLIPRTGVAVLGEGDLYFSSVTQADEGVYFCVATNEYVGSSRTSRTAVLEVRAGAIITTPPTNTEVVLGDDLSLTCAASGDPGPTLRWLKDNIEVMVGQRVTIGDTGGLLHIIGMNSLDRGTYTCEAKNDYGMDTESVFVNVLVPPRLVSSPLDLGTGIGTSILMPCRVIAEPPATVSWFKDGEELTFDPPGSHYQKTTDGLFISDVQLSDNGVYLCMAENKVGILEANGTITVETVPVFSRGPENQTVSEGSVVTFHCMAEGVPPPTISWAYNHGSLPSGSGLSMSHQVLTIPLATRDLNGMYTCRAENSQGLIRKDAYLSVQSPPVLQHIMNITADTDETVSAICDSLHGFPDLTFSWLKETNILTASGDHVQFPQPNELRINLQGNEDQGWYTCVATNALGSAREKFYISVLDIPQVPEILDVIALTETSLLVTWDAGAYPEDTETFDLEYRMSGDSWRVAESNIPNIVEIGSLVIEGLTENREYRIRVRAHNRLGSSPPSSHYVAYTPSVSGPSAPRRLKILSFNATTVQLEWEIPERRSSPIEVYFIDYYKIRDNWVKWVPVSLENDRSTREGRYTIDHVVDNLQPNSLYAFQVCGATFSSEGEIQLGNCSYNVHQVTGTAALPEEVQNGEILGYNVTYMSLTSKEVKSVAASEMTTSIANLDPYTEYDIYLEAYNADGLSPPSVTATARTKVAGLKVSTEYEVTVSAYNLEEGSPLDGPRSSIIAATADGVPGMITDLMIGDIGPTFALLKWSAPLEERGDILGYRIQYTVIETLNSGKDLHEKTRREVVSTSNNSTHVVTVFSKETQYNITGLTSETNYSLTIMAQTTAGFGEALLTSSPQRRVTILLITLHLQMEQILLQAWRTSQRRLETSGASIFHYMCLSGNFCMIMVIILTFFIRNSFAIFTSAVGLAFVFFLLAVFFVTAWCSRASGKKQAKSRLAPLIRDDQFVQISSQSGEEGVDNYSRTESSSPTPSSFTGAPTSSRVLDEQNLIQNRPRASSSPASAQLSVRAVPNHYGGTSHYGTNPPVLLTAVHYIGQETSRSARSLDTSPDQLDDLYQKVNRTSRGPSRFKKDSLAAIAALLDQEESDNEGRPPDSPPSVVIADQRTIL